MNWLDKLLGGPPPVGPAVPSVSAQALMHVIDGHGFVGDLNRVVGMVDGLEVVVEREAIDFGGTAEPAERLLVRVRLAVRLDLGLRVTRAGESDPRRPFTTENAAFNSTFLALADEPLRGQSLINSALAERLVLGPETELTDTFVTVAIGESDATRIEEAIRHGVDVAQELQQGRLETPTASALREFEAAWQTMAEADGLRLERTPLSAEVLLGRSLCDVQAVRDGFGQYHFELRALFPKDLGVGLTLRPQNAKNENNWDSEPLGDRAFDRLFSIRARTTQVAQLFDTTVRGDLVKLRHAGLQVRADDRAVTAWLGFRKDNLQGPVRQLSALATIAEGIFLRASEPTLRR